MKSAQEIVNEILSHVRQVGGEFNEWYAGIASDPSLRLFNDHNVSLEFDAWIYRQCASSDIARTIENHLINNLGFDGGNGGGDHNSIHVYAYKKRSYTKQ